MHTLIGTALLTALIAFAFGPFVARMFVAALLTVASFFILFLVTVGVVGSGVPAPQTVHYAGESRAHALARYCAAIPEPPSCAQDRHNAMASR